MNNKKKIEKEPIALPTTEYEGKHNLFLTRMQKV